jgi:hypothetical protein
MYRHFVVLNACASEIFGTEVLLLNCATVNELCISVSVQLGEFNDVFFYERLVFPRLCCGLLDYKIVSPSSLPFPLSSFLTVNKLER